MRYAAVPRHYRRGEGGAPDHVVLWVCAIGDGAEAPPAAVVRFGGSEVPVAWRYAFQARVHTDEVAIPVGPARAEVRVEVGGRVVATALVAAPPVKLPGPGERPYTVLIGSCYGVHRDKERLLARAAETLARADASPDVKFLCGDQVYLDGGPTHPSHEPLAERFLGKYTATWSDAGLLPLLRHGATYLTADDHEFWNEYPAMRGTGSRTAEWESLARELFTLFQRREEPDGFAAGAVSFFALDTRLDRDDELDQFAPPARMDALQRWLDALPGPGVLVLGETFFGEKWTVATAAARGLGEVSHRPTIHGTLQEHAQYKRLTEMLASSGKTVVLVAGDVHWGRIAECRMPNGTRLLEVVSSPLTLADPGYSRPWRPWTKAPSPFEAAGLSAEVETLETPSGEPYQPAYNHFCTLEFSTPADGAGVRLAVRHWPVGDHAPPGEIVYETLL